MMGFYSRSYCSSERESHTQNEDAQLTGDRGRPVFSKPCSLFFICSRQLGLSKRSVHDLLFITSVANRKKGQEEDTWGLCLYERHHSPLL